MSEDTGLPFRSWWPLIGGALVGLLMRLVFSGALNDAFSTMGASFIVLCPALVGAITVYLAERQSRRSWGSYFVLGALANMLFVSGTLLALIEGLICAIIILPLFGLLGGLSGLAMGAVCRLTNWPRQAVTCVAVLPFVLGGIEPRIPLPDGNGSVERAILIDATPERIWEFLENARDIRPDEVDSAWMYRIGVPVPTAGVSEHTGPGVVRHVTMGKGIRFDQVATEWAPNRRVLWTYRFAPDSFPPGALDDHVRIGGHYFDLRDTEYVLTPMGKRTELRIRMRYRVSTHFNWYAEPIARFLIGNFEDTILKFYARRAEL